jgi:hypothetical protein
MTSCTATVRIHRRYPSGPCVSVSLALPGRTDAVLTPPAFPCLVDVGGELDFPAAGGGVITERLAATGIPVQGNPDCPG